MPKPDRQSPVSDTDRHAQAQRGWRRRFAQLRAVVWTAFALSAIVLAGAVGLSTLLLPYASHYKGQLESWLAGKLGEPVSIETLQGRWQGPGPRFSISQLRVGQGEEALLIESAELHLDLMAALRPGASVSELYLLTERVEVSRDASGEWSVAGLPARGPGSFGSLPLAVGFRTGELRISDPARDIDLVLPDVQASLRPLEGGMQLHGDIDYAQSGQSSFVLQTDGAGVAIYLSASDIDLGRWLNTTLLGGARVSDGHLDGELWLRWAGARIDELSFRGGLENLVLSNVLATPDGSTEVRFALESLDGLLQYATGQEGTTIDFRDGAIVSFGESWPASEATVRIDPEGRWTAAAEHLELGDLARLLTVIDVLPDARRLALYEAAFNGHLTDLSLAGTGRDPAALHGTLELAALSWLDRDAIPGLAGLNAQARFDSGQLAVDLTAEPGAMLDAPQVFREPLPLDRLAGQVQTDLAAETLVVESKKLDLQIGTAQAQTRFGLTLNGGRPFVDIRGWVSDGDVSEASRFWPHRKFKPNLIQWLDRALVAGTVSSGAFVLYGDLDEWPFRGSEGRFEARAIVENGLLDFHPQWPEADQAEVDLYFDARGLRAESPSARFGNLQVGPVSVVIDDFRNPVVRVDAASGADASDLLGFLRRTPIYERYAPYLDGFEAVGPASSDAQVRLPLRPELGVADVSGRVALDGVDLAEEAWDLEFLNSSGLLSFSGEGLLADGVQTHWKGSPAMLRLATGVFVRNAARELEITLQGPASAGDFVDRVPVLEPVLNRIAEATLWTAELTVEKTDDPLPPDAGGRGLAQLALTSSLRSSALTLPAPLDKPRGEVLPVTITMDLPETEQLSLDVGDVLAMRIDTLSDDGSWAGTLHFGGGAPRDNDQPGLLIEGAIESLDVDGWRDLIDELVMTPNASQRWLTSLDLQVDSLLYAGRLFSDLTLKTSRDDNYWTLNLEGDELQGRVRLPLTVDTNRLLLAEFDRFEWPSSEASIASPEFHPSIIPPLRFLAESLRFHDVEYGRVSFETYPTREGMHIAELETVSPIMQVSATGDWEQADGQHSSNFAITITGDDLGRILANFGFTELFDGGQTFVRLDSRWDGAPSDFEMARLGGDLDVRITNGQIMEVQPGAGRIFGLISLQALPRRLQLDFSDLFKSGLTFDAIEGNFLLEMGDAYTDNLTIRGPTANIEIQGRAGLAARDYDQVITVIPEVGATLPLVGALAGGGAGAAAAFVLQNMFGRQIDKISQFHYSVSGSWEDPAVDLIGADDRKLELETARLMRRRFEQENADPQ